MVEVYREPVTRQFFAPRWSLAYLLSHLANFVIVILPFLLAYPFHENGTIWLKEEKYWEQPQVTYTYKFITTLLVKDSITGRINELYYSSNPSANTLRDAGMNSARIATATVRSREIDSNIDGLTDQVVLSIVFPLNENEEVYSAQAILLFDYQLKEKVKLDTEAVVYVNDDTAVARNTLVALGELSFQQSHPLNLRHYDNGVFQGYSDHSSVWNDSSFAKDIEYSEISNTMMRFSNRDYVASFEKETLIWTSGNMNYFNFTILTNIPAGQEVRFVPMSVDIIKEAWVKYLSILLVIQYFVRAGLAYVLKKQIVGTRVVLCPTLSTPKGKEQ